jgi:hypothetical protein
LAQALLAKEKAMTLAKSLSAQVRAAALLAVLVAEKLVG